MNLYNYVNDKISIVSNFVIIITIKYCNQKSQVL